MAEAEGASPRLIVMPIDEAPWSETKPQVHADGRLVKVRRRTLERSAERTVLLTYYDPGLVLRAHTHPCEQITHLIEGEFRSGETLCKAPAVLILPEGAVF